MASTQPRTQDMSTSVTEASTGSKTLPIILVLAIALVIGAVSYAMIGSREATSQANMELQEVQFGDLVISVTEDGAVESASNIDIKCEVVGGSSILWIVEDGKQVDKGEKLVEFDASTVEDQINTQKIVYERARSTVIQAKKNYDVAQISVREYLEGTYVKQIQDAESLITISMENLRSAQNSLEHAKRMFRKGYISPLELESQQFGVQRAQLDLDSANTAKEVLEKFTKVKTLEDLKSQVEIAKAAMESEQAAFALEEARLKRLEEDLNKCLVNAPQDGMVVYANERQGRRGGQSSQSSIEEGAAVRERQDILRLPDLTKMQVRVTVHESKVDQLTIGMPAVIRIQDRELKGTVNSVANQPEPSSFFSTSIKEYAAVVAIDGQPEGLKPGMTAEAKILIAHLKNVLTVPVTAVVEKATSEFYCWVKTPRGVEARPVVLGLSDDKLIAIKDGLVEGDIVVHNPRATIPEAREVAKGEQDFNVEERFGTAPSAAPPREVQSDPSGETGASVRPEADGDQERGDAEPRGGDAREPSRQGSAGGNARPGIMEFDQNNDGQITRDEVPEERQRIFDFLDSNGDGVIDQTEAQARSGRGGGGPGGGRVNLMDFDQNGDEKVTREEVPEEQLERFDRTDENQDGVVDQAEIDARRSRFRESGGQGRGGL